MPNGAPRLEGFDYVGVFCYSLTICAHERRAVFVEPLLVDWVLQHILRTAVAEHFEILAYCFMPDHLHVLAQGHTDNADLRVFMKRLKQQTGYEYTRRYGERLWQVGYFDHVVRSEESVLKHARYIVGNPVRAGLVRNVDEYPFAAILMDGADAQSLWS